MNKWIKNLIVSTRLGAAGRRIGGLETEVCEFKSTTSDSNLCEKQTAADRT